MFANYHWNFNRDEVREPFKINWKFQIIVKQIVFQRTCVTSFVEYNPIDIAALLNIGFKLQRIEHYVNEWRSNLEV